MHKDIKKKVMSKVEHGSEKIANFARNEGGGWSGEEWKQLDSNQLFFFIHLFIIKC